MNSKTFLRMLHLPVITFILLAGAAAPVGSLLEEALPQKASGFEFEDGDDSFKIFPDPAGKAYFPEGKASYYTQYFSAMKEPSLQADLPAGATFVLRLTILPSFSDNIMVRIFDQDGKIHMRAVWLRRAQNGDPLKITKDTAIVLDQELPGEIKNLIADQSAWKPITNDEEGNAGLDGETWIFEMRDKKGYHMLDVWCPDEERGSDELLRAAGFDPAQIRDYAPYVKAGNALLKLAKFERDVAKTE